jgi:hypothetical protein
MRALALFAIFGMSAAACQGSRDLPRASTPTSSAELGPIPAITATPEPTTIPTTAPTASAPPAVPTPVAVPMPNDEDIKAALALKCSKRKEGAGCTDKAGKTVIPFAYDGAVAFKKSGLALVLDPKKGFALINVRNETVLEPFMFDNGPDPIADGLARVRRDGKIGFVDAEWRLVIAPQFDAAFPFAGGSAKVCVGCDPRVWSAEAPPDAKRGRELRIDHAGKEL